MDTPLRIAFGPAVCSPLAEGGDREWLVADGSGVCDGHRLRAAHPPLPRHAGAGRRRPIGSPPRPGRPGPGAGTALRHLGVHEWAGGAVAPAGHTFLESFDLDDGLPRWRWRVGDVVLERELAMRHGTSSLAVVHRLLAGGPVRLVLDVGRRTDPRGPEEQPAVESLCREHEIAPVQHPPSDTRWLIDRAADYRVHTIGHWS